MPGERLNLLARRAAETVEHEEWPLALLVYEELVAQLPHDPKVHFNKGLVHVKLAQFDQARVEFQTALQLKADYTWAQEALQNVDTELRRRNPTAPTPTTRDAVTLPPTPAIVALEGPLPAAQRLAVGRALIDDAIAEMETTQDLMRFANNQLLLEGRLARSIEFGLSIIRDTYNTTPSEESRSSLSEAATILGDIWSRIARGKKELLGITVNDTAATRYRQDYTRAEMTTNRFLAEALTAQDNAHARFVLGQFREICLQQPDEAMAEYAKVVLLDAEGPYGLSATQRMVHLKIEGHHLDPPPVTTWGSLLISAGQAALKTVLAQMTHTSDLMQDAAHQGLLEGRLAREVELALTTMREGLAINNSPEARGAIAAGLTLLGEHWVRIAQGRKQQMTNTHNPAVAARFADDLARAEMTAERYLHEALSLVNSPAGHIQLGILHHRCRGNYTQAVEEFRYAIASDPDGDAGMDAATHLMQLSSEGHLPGGLPVDEWPTIFTHVGQAAINHVLRNLVTTDDIIQDADQLQIAFEGPFAQNLNSGLYTLRAVLKTHPAPELTTSIAHTLAEVANIWSRIARGKQGRLDASQDSMHTRYEQEYRRAVEATESLAGESLGIAQTALANYALGAYLAIHDASRAAAHDALCQAILLDIDGPIAIQATQELVRLMDAGYEITPPATDAWGELLLRAGHAFIASALATLEHTGDFVRDTVNQGLLEGPLAKDIDQGLATLRKAIAVTQPTQARCAIARTLADLGAIWCEIAQGRKIQLSQAVPGPAFEKILEDSQRAEQVTERYLTESLALSDTSTARYALGLFRIHCQGKTVEAADEFRRAITLNPYGDYSARALTHLARISMEGHTAELLDGEYWSPLLLSVGRSLIANALAAIPRTGDLSRDAAQQVALENALSPDITLGIELLEEALEVSPTHEVREGVSLQIAELGAVWVRIAQGRRAQLTGNSPEMLTRTREELTRAEQMAEQMLVNALAAYDTAPARLALGQFRATCQERYADAAQEFRQAVHLDPSGPVGMQAAKLFLLQEAQGQTHNIESKAPGVDGDLAETAQPTSETFTLIEDIERQTTIRLGSDEDSSRVNTTDASRRAQQVSGQKKGPCYIATACYGDYNHPNVRILRRFRDECLYPTPLGRTFIACYYTLSPSLAARLEGQTWLTRVVRRFVLDPLVSRLQQKRR